jgi:hypothetical protein
LRGEFGFWIILSFFVVRLQTKRDELLQDLCFVLVKTNITRKQYVFGLK